MILLWAGKVHALCESQTTNFYFWRLAKNLINDLFNVFLAIFKLAFISFQIYGVQLYKIGPKHIKIGFPTLYLSLSFLPSAAHVPSLLCPSGTNFIKSGVGTKFIAIVSGNKYSSLMNRRVGLSHPAPQIFEDYSNANDLRVKICEISFR